MGSMNVEKIADRHYKIQDGVEYGIYLEDGIGMEARPFMMPIFNDWEQRIPNIAKRGGLLP